MVFLLRELSEQKEEESDIFVRWPIVCVTGEKLSRIVKLH